MIRGLAIAAVMAMLFISGCGGRPPSGLARFPGADSVLVTKWPEPDPTHPNAPPPPLWLPGTRRVQVAITPYVTSGGTQYLVWVVSNGTHLLAVYFVTQKQHDEIFTRIGQQEPPAMEVLQLPSRHGTYARLEPRTRLCPSCGVSPSRLTPDNLYAWQAAPAPPVGFTYTPPTGGGSGPVGSPPPPDDGDSVLTTTSATNHDISADVN